MSSTSQNRSVAAAADLIEAERTLAALPLARRGDGDREVLIALVNAVLPPILELPQSRSPKFPR